MDYSFLVSSLKKSFAVLDIEDTKNAFVILAIEPRNSKQIETRFKLVFEYISEKQQTLVINYSNKYVQLARALEFRDSCLLRTGYEDDNFVFIRGKRRITFSDTLIAIAMNVQKRGFDFQSGVFWFFLEDLGNSSFTFNEIFCFLVTHRTPNEKVSFLICEGNRLSVLEKRDFVTVIMRGDTNECLLEFPQGRSGFILVSSKNILRLIGWMHRVQPEDLTFESARDYVQALCSDDYFFGCIPSSFVRTSWEISEDSSEYSDEEASDTEALKKVLEKKGKGNHTLCRYNVGDWFELAE